MPSLYVHVPFCLKKCAYCAFYSVPLSAEQSRSTLIRTYLTSLEKEMHLRHVGIPGTEPISSLFIGGGTPTALTAEELDCLLGMLHEHYNLGAPHDVLNERTCEANPGTLSAAKLQILRRHGINRLSLGVQSFSDRMLQALGRIHTGNDVRESVTLIRQAGFNNLNLDLMFGLPDQEMKDWQQTLEEAIQLQPEHLSVYGLMLEDGTPLAQNLERLVLPDDDLQAEMYDLARAMLVKAGYRHYETSNFSLPGAECRHNLTYWQGGDYIGLGPGAVSYKNKRRSKNYADGLVYARMLEEGLLPLDPEEDECLTSRERMTERIMLGLRLEEGLDLEHFAREFAQNLTDIYPDVLERYLKQDVLALTAGKLKLNKDFWFVANAVLQEFV